VEFEKNLSLQTEIGSFLPYKQRVGGSNPSTRTQVMKHLAGNCQVLFSLLIVRLEDEQDQSGADG
jgi:hypothetical protein